MPLLYSGPTSHLTFGSLAEIFPGLSHSISWLKEYRNDLIKRWRTEGELAGVGYTVKSNDGSDSSRDDLEYMQADASLPLPLICN
jgi:hypothetical protein